MKVLIIGSSNELNHTLVKYAIDTLSITNFALVCSAKGVQTKWATEQPNQSVYSSNQAIVELLESFPSNLVVEALSAKLLKCGELITAIRGSDPLPTAAQKPSFANLVVATDQPLKFDVHFKQPWNNSFDQVWISKCTNASKIAELKHIVGSYFGAVVTQLELVLRSLKKSQFLCLTSETCTVSDIPSPPKQEGIQETNSETKQDHTVPVSVSDRVTNNLIRSFVSFKMVWKSTNDNELIKCITFELTNPFFKMCLKEIHIAINTAHIEVWEDCRDMFVQLLFRLLSVMKKCKLLDEVSLSV